MGNFEDQANLKTGGTFWKCTSKTGFVDRPMSPEGLCPLTWAVTNEENDARREGQMPIGYLG
jgi:hypothetical protein